MVLSHWLLFRDLMNFVGKSLAYYKRLLENLHLLRKLPLVNWLAYSVLMDRKVKATQVSINY
jgi:hypothetical protein